MTRFVTPFFSLLKLGKIGIAGKARNIFQEYLSHREQCVRIGNSISELLPVTSRVPQGSLLGPALLFLVYVNDMPEYVLHSHIYSFADDTKFYRQVQSPSDIALLQQDIDSICRWSNDSQLQNLFPLFLLTPDS